MVLTSPPLEFKGAGAQEIGYWVTRHGPAIVEDNQRVITLKWAAADPGHRGFSENHHVSWYVGFSQKESSSELPAARMG